jgi:putative aldouronate transport system substrate-binding protein
MLLEGPDGEIHIRQEGKGNAGMFMFNTNTVKDETHLKKLLGFLDTMQEPEMQLLCRFGLEGVHYEQQEDGIEVIDRNRIGVEVDPFQQLWTQYEDLVTLAVVPEISKYEEEIRKEANKHLEVNPITPLISETMVEKGPSLKQIIDDASVKYIMGEIDDAGWQTAIDRWLREGGQNVIDEYTTEYNQTGRF